MLAGRLRVDRRSVERVGEAGSSRVDGDDARSRRFREGRVPREIGERRSHELDGGARRRRRHQHALGRRGGQQGDATADQVLAQRPRHRQREPRRSVFARLRGPCELDGVEGIPAGLAVEVPQDAARDGRSPSSRTMAAMASGSSGPRVTAVDRPVHAVAVSCLAVSGWRRASTIPIGTPASRRNAWASARSDATSIHCRSSTASSTGPSAAAARRSERTPAATARWSIAGAASSSSIATASAWRCGSGNSIAEVGDERLDQVGQGAERIRLVGLGGGGQQHPVARGLRLGDRAPPQRGFPDAGLPLQDRSPPASDPGRRRTPAAWRVPRCDR